jgi:hypothetical protein
MAPVISGAVSLTALSSGPRPQSRFGSRVAEFSPEFALPGYFFGNFQHQEEQPAARTTLSNAPPISAWQGQGTNGGEGGRTAPLRRRNDRGNPSTIQNSQESLTALSKRCGINPKTVAKWKKRGSVTDLPTDPKEPKSASFAIIVAFRKHTLLPLDDCLYALQATIPRLTRSSLHCCFQRHGISRLPDVEDGNGIKRNKFKTYVGGG